MQKVACSFIELLFLLSVLLCYFIMIAKVHKVLYLAYKSVQLSDSFPYKFCKILENFVKLVPKLCPFRNFFSQGSETFLSCCALPRIIGSSKSYPSSDSQTDRQSKETVEHLNKLQI